MDTESENPTLPPLTTATAHRHTHPTAPQPMPRNTTQPTAQAPDTMPTDAQAPEAQPSAFLAALTAAAAELVQHLPSQATGAPRLAPTIRDAGSDTVTAQLKACVDRYGDTLQPLAAADGWVRQYGGARAEHPPARKRQNASTLLAAVLHAEASKPEGLKVDDLYEAIMIARSKGLGPVGAIKPGTGPEHIVMLACSQFNCGYVIAQDENGADVIRHSGHKIGKPGSNKWMKVETPEPQAETVEEAN